MSISDISNGFGFLGGLGMFLYGMNIMADGMQKTAGSKMSSFLGMLTNNRFLAVALGALITAIIQSSGATTVMVVGFVSAGVLNLSQAVGVIMGANIGTTITAWIVSMSQLGDAFEVMKPGFYAPAIIGIGALLLVFAKSQKKKTIGEIMIGLGLLFIGLDFMSGSINPYTDAPIFAKAFEILGGNPLLGMIIGALVTALLQSSSASVGILQTLAMNGIVTTNAAIYITLGQNIGSCVTAMLSSMGGSRTAKRAAVMHLTFNVIGAIVFGSIGFIFFSLRPAFAASNINAVQISIFHTIFNLTMTTLLFPFADVLVKISGMVVKEKAEEEPVAEDAETAATLKHLDERIFESPAFAVETAALEVVHMGQITYENVVRAIDAVLTVNSDEVETVFKTEQTINNMEKMLTEYLIKVDNLSLTEKQKKVVNNLFYSVSDIERIGDHAADISEMTVMMASEPYVVDLSDIKKMASETVLMLIRSIEAYVEKDMLKAQSVIDHDDIVDELFNKVKQELIEMIRKNPAVSEQAADMLMVAKYFERIGDHATNLAELIIFALDDKKNTMQN